ncbi:MAG: hypothetical protein ACRD1V_19240 [Vicinamibacterales bacterium]
MIANDWQRRFDDLAARRTAAASVPLPPVRTIADRGAQRGLTAIADSWSSTVFDGPFYQTPSDGGLSCGVVFVRSADGNTGTDDPSSLGGGPVDEHVIYEGLTRVAADGVVIGAGTLSRDSFFTVWRPELVELRDHAFGLPCHPAQIVLTADGSVDAAGVLLFNVPSVPVFVITSPAGADRLSAALRERPWITAIPGSSLGDQLDALRRHGLRRLISVGGRRSASELVDGGFVRDVYLTTTASHEGAPGTPWYTGTRHLSLETVVVKEWNGADGVVHFEHSLLR